MMKLKVLQKIVDSGLVAAGRAEISEQTAASRKLALKAASRRSRLLNDPVRSERHPRPCSAAHHRRNPHRDRDSARFGDSTGSNSFRCAICRKPHSEPRNSTAM